MLPKTITYTDYNGVERTETFYFNLNKAELAEMQVAKVGGLDAMLQKIIETQDIPGIADIFKKIILKSYGEKSADGKRFIKSEELSTAFSQTEAYSELYMELATDADKASQFVNGIIPKEFLTNTTPELKAVDAHMS